MDLIISFLNQALSTCKMRTISVLHELKRKLLLLLLLVLLLLLSIQNQERIYERMYPTLIKRCG